jgi:signal transduction histidine kinase
MTGQTLTHAGDTPPNSSLPSPEPRNVRILEWSVTGLTLCVLATLLGTGWGWNSGSLNAWDGVSWGALLLLVDLAPVRYSDQMQVTMSLPLLLAAGMILSPPQVAIIAFLGSIDPRELRRRISPQRSLFNRSVIALSSLAASAAFHSFGVRIDSWPAVLPITLLCVVIDTSLNWGLVSLAQSFASRKPLQVALRGMVGPSIPEFALTYVSFGLGSLLIASADIKLGVWGLIASLALLALARQMFAHRREANRAAEVVAAKDRALIAMTARIAEERKDERARVAGALHDDVLGGLYQIELSSEVLRQDLGQGRLLELESDLPQLTDATRGAAAAMRKIIRDLRCGPLAAGELDTTLRLLVDDVASRTRATLVHDLQEIEAPPLVQLVLYQVAKEALENAIRHSRASEIRVRLKMDDDGAAVRVVVTDDGLGFDRSTVDSTSHYGLQLMKERIEAVGGVLLIESARGAGTLVAARLPVATRGWEVENR